jgi:hypothetical protein
MVLHLSVLLIGILGLPGVAGDPPNANIWSELSVGGVTPSGRRFAAGSTWPMPNSNLTRLLVAGGFGIREVDSQQAFLKDLWSYFPPTSSWTNLSALPICLAAHTMASFTVNETTSLFIYGGMTSYPLCNGDFSISSQPLLITSSVLNFSQWTVLNAPPGPRAHHASAMAGQCLFVHGGFTALGTIGGDTWVLDVMSMAWQRLPSNMSDYPTAR